MDIGGRHVVRQEADIHLGGDELHRDIVGDLVNGDGGILVYLAGHAVEEAVLQPLPGFRAANLVTGGAAALKGGSVNTGMEGGVVRAHIVQEQGVELFQGSDIIQLQGVEPTLLKGTEVALHLGLTGSIPHLGVEQDCTQRAADEGELLIGVGGAVVHIELHGDAVGGDSGLEHLLEVVGGVVVEKPAPNQEPGVVVYDHDAVDTPPPAILGNVGQITGVRLPQLPERVLLKCLAVPQIGIPGAFQVVVLDIALNGAHAHRGWDEALFHQLPVDLRGVEPGKCLFEAVDLLNSGVRENTGSALVRTLPGHERLNSSVLVLGHPFGDCPRTVPHHASIRECKGIACDAFIVRIA